jgi:short-subunit dehydrogenase
MNSIASIKTFPLSTYSASKAASYSLTQALRTELGPKGYCTKCSPGSSRNSYGRCRRFENPADTTVVSEGIINALEAGDFHLFPDEMAKQIEAAYQSFSDNVIMVDFSNNNVEQGRVLL